MHALLTTPRSRVERDRRFRGKNLLRRRHLAMVDTIDHEEPGVPSTYKAMDLALRVGELMLASGESTESVADAMRKVTSAYGLPHCEANVTFTAISLSYLPGGGAAPVTGERKVRRRYPDYSRLIEVHALVREAARGGLELDEAIDRLREIKRRAQTHPQWLVVVSLALVAASAGVMAGGGPIVAIAAFAATILGDQACAWLARRGVAEFYQIATAAAIGTSVASLMIWLETPAKVSAVVIGCVVALLPGRPLVASLQDGIAGDYVTSSARILEVFFTVAAIITGTGGAMYAAVRLGVPIYLDTAPSVPLSLHEAQTLGAVGVSAAFALWLLVPWRDIPAVALGGALSWCSYVLLRGEDFPPVLAAGVAAAIIGLLGTLYARRRHVPSHVYVVPAIAPLLPGAMLYSGMLELNAGDPGDGVLSLVQAISVALALGAGVNLGAEMVRSGDRRSARRLRPAARRTRGY